MRKQAVNWIGERFRTASVCCLGAASASVANADITFINDPQTFAGGRLIVQTHVDAFSSPILAHEDDDIFEGTLLQPNGELHFFDTITLTSGPLSDSNSDGSCTTCGYARSILDGSLRVDGATCPNPSIPGCAGDPAILAHIDIEADASGTIFYEFDTNCAPDECQGTPGQPEVIATGTSPHWDPYKVEINFET